MPNVPSGSSFDSFDRGLRSLLEEPVGPRRTGAPVAEDDDPFLRDLGNLLETERAAEEAPRPRIGVPALPSREVPAPPEPSVFDLTDAQARTPFEMGGMLSPQRTADISLSPVAPPAPVLATGGINAAADVASMRQSVSTFRAGAGLAERFGERILGPMIATAAPKVADVGISAVKGSIGMVEAGVGALDLATESTGPSQAMARMGFQPAQAKAILDRYYSAPQRQAFAAVEEADGLLSKTRAVLENPSVVLHSVVESAPTMVAAAAVARGSGLSPAVAGPLGEAVLSAGATNAAITQDNPAASDRERAIALASGAATGLLGNFSGRLAKSLGVTDIDTLLAGAALSPSAGQNLARRIIIGAVQEGFLEELPQSVQEQIAQNLALRRPPWDGVDDAAVLGTLTGAAMGGGTQMLTRSPASSQSRGPATFQAPWNPRGLPADGVRTSAPAQEAQAPAPPPQAAPPPVPPPAAPPVARARQEEAPPVEAPPPAQTVEPAPVSQEEASPPSESDLARERAIDALMAKLEAEAQAAPPADEDVVTPEPIEPDAKSEGLATRDQLFVIRGRDRLPVDSVEDAATKWEDFRDAVEEDGPGAGGVSELGNGLRVERADGTEVARISYNGRIWNPDGTVYRGEVPPADVSRATVEEKPAPPRTWRSLSASLGDDIGELLVNGPWELANDSENDEPRVIDVSDRSRSNGRAGRRGRALSEAEFVDWLASPDADAVSRDEDWRDLVARSREALGVTIAPAEATATVPRGTQPRAFGGIVEATPVDLTDEEAEARGRMLRAESEAAGITVSPPVADGAPAPETRAPQAATNGPTVTWDEDHKSVTVKFPKKPLASTLDKLKKEGFKWSKASGAWFHRKPEQLTTKSGTFEDVKRFAVEKTKAMIGLPVAEEMRQLAQRTPEAQPPNQEPIAAADVPGSVEQAAPAQPPPETPAATTPPQRATRRTKATAELEALVADKQQRKAARIPEERRRLAWRRMSVFYKGEAKDQQAWEPVEGEDVTLDVMPDEKFFKYYDDSLKKWHVIHAASGLAVDSHDGEIAAVQSANARIRGVGIDKVRQVMARDAAQRPPKPTFEATATVETEFETPTEPDIAPAPTPAPKTAKTSTRKPQEATKPAAPAKTYRKLGMDPTGKFDIEVDENGIRSYNDGGTRRFETVAMVPTRAGVKTQRANPDIDRDFWTWDEAMRGYAGPERVETPAEPTPAERAEGAKRVTESARTAFSDLAKKRADLAAKRAGLKDEIAAKVDAIQKEVGKLGSQLNAGIPVPPRALVAKVYDLAVLYGKVGIVDLEDGWLAFEEDFGDGYQALRRAFELAWDMVRPTVAADAGTAQTETQEADRATDQTQARGNAGPGDAPDVRGDRTAADRTGGGSSLAPVPAADRGEPRSAREDGAADRDSSGVVADGVPAGPVAGGRDAGGARLDGVSGRPLSVAGDRQDAGPQPADYVLTPERIAAIIGRGGITRVRDNIAAIKLVKTLRDEQRNATPEEQDVLAKYVGWGASDAAAFLAEYPDSRWSAAERGIWQSIQDSTTSDERAALVRSTPNAHFTFDLYTPIWSALARFGLNGGRILEPAVGAGHAFGLMPATIRHNARLQAVELDPITATIAQALYPSARVQAVGYEQARIAKGTQDLVISNVPFGDFGVVDKSKPDFITRRIHNYFFDKALDHVRDGGYIVFVTSRYTMDASSGAAFRRHLMTRAHFLGAVRLPNSAFGKTAKTEVVTDIIVLQKRAAGETGESRNADLFIQAPAVPSLASTSYRRGKTVTTNVYRSAYYEANPTQVLGTETTGGTMYGGGEYTVEARKADVLQDEISSALLDVLPPNSYQTTPAAETIEGPAVVLDDFKAGEFRIGPKGELLTVDRDGTATPYREKLSTKSVDRIKGMVGVRDALRTVMTTMADAASTDAQVKAAQKALKKAYDAFVAKHKGLNETTNKRLFARDPEASNLLSLEVTKVTSTVETGKDGKRVRKITKTIVGLADIFTKRTIQAQRAVESVNTPEDALLASLGVKTVIDWPYMAQLAGKPVEALQDALVQSGRLFVTPGGEWVTSDQYLSGDVVTKLEDAKAAVEAGETSFTRNVTALEQVQPARKEASAIKMALGSHWIPAEHLMQFAKEQHGRYVQITRTSTSSLVSWAVTGRDTEKRHDLAVVYHDGTETYTFLDLLNDALNLRLPELGWWEGRGDDRRYVKDPKGTTAARANLDDLRSRWLEWLVEHPTIEAELTDIYNARFNRTVPWVPDGSHLANMRDGERTAALPGLALPFGLYPHQLRAVWRILTSGNTLLAHEVGAGKTFEMIIAAMEMRRTGRASKPMITVPTYLLGAWRDDIKRAYPQAKLLAFEEQDLASDKRQSAMARIATGDWDIVLVPHSSFTLLKNSDARMAEVLRGFVEELVDAIEEAKTAAGEDAPSVKQLEKARRKMEDKMNKRLDAAQKGNDNNLTWDQLGVDALFVDEAHAFKNLYFHTNMDNLKGLSRSEADRALDIFVKIASLNEQTNYRNVVLATATPIMNSMVELYTMQRYLQPHTLRAQGIEAFDAWYTMFGEAANVIEIRPDGTFAETRRLKHFRNLGTLYQMVTDVMDYVGWGDMPYLTLPKIKGDKVQLLEAPSHPLMARLTEWFSERLAILKENPPKYNHKTGTYEAPTRVHPITGQSMGRFDNILTVMNDATLAAIDPRLVLPGHATDFSGSRLQMVADEAAKTFREEAEHKGTVLIFLDHGTPKTPGPLAFMAGETTEDATGGDALGVEDELADETFEDDALGDTAWNLYDSLRDALIARKVPAKQIAYVHQASTPAERVALFEAVNSGQVRIVIASTDKGGVGMNVQQRLAHLIEMGPPRYRRPGDIRQRWGRGIRQGNTYADRGGIKITRLVTKSPMDAWTYGVIATKWAQIESFMRGNATEFSEQDAMTESIDDAIAITSGDNPLAVELIDLKPQLIRLRAQADAADRAVATARSEARSYQSQIRSAEEDLREITAIVESIADTETRGVDFRMSVDGTVYTKPSEANAALVDYLKGLTDATVPTDTKIIGWIGDEGIPVSIQRTVATRGPVLDVRLWIKGRHWSTPYAGVLFGDPLTFEGKNFVASLQNKIDDIRGRPEEQKRHLTYLRERLAESEQAITAAFPAREKLEKLEQRVKEIEQTLAAQGAASEADAKEKLKTSSSAQVATAKQGGGPPGATGGVSDASVMPGTLPVRPAPTAAAIPKRTTPPTQARRLEVPELVALAKALLGVPDLVKSFRKAEKMGEFRGWGGIRLSLDLFKPGNEQMLAEVLAHEIGHLIDWLPDHTMTRGNLLGRLNTLRQYMRHTYVTPSSGMVERLKVIRPELIALSKVWRPWDREPVTDSMRQYRDSSRELYADALSALLNDPGFVKAQAPKFYDAFFEGLHEKPDAEQAYLDLLDVVNGGQVDVTEARRGRLVESFETGDVKAKDIRTRKDATKAARAADLWTRFRVQLFTKHTPFADRVRQLAKQGTAVAERLNPVYALDERNYLSGKLKAWVQRHVQPLKDTLDEVNVPWSAFGELLFYDRIISGDSSEKANPQGLSVPHVTDMRERLRAGLSATQWRTLTEQTDRFREAVKDVARMAYEAGLYTEATWNDIEANPAYATFRVLDYMDQELSSRVMRRVGTLKDIQHPGDATVLKTLKTLSAIEHNRVKTIAITFLRDNFAADIEPARTLFDKDRRLHRPIPPPTKEQRLVTFYEKGKWTGVYVDPYIADSLDNLSYGHDWFVTRGLRWINGKWFRQVFTGLNLGFQSYNLMKDFIRYWKNNPGWSPATALRRYYEAVPLAKIRAWGLPAKPTAADLDAFETLLQAEEGGMLALTFNDILDGREPEETQIEQTLRDVGALPAERASAYLSVRAWSFLMEQIRKAGDFVETLPKAAAIYDSVHRMQTTSQRVGAVRVPSVRTIGPERREFIRRKIGSPDFLAGGTYTPLSNELFLFSNAIVQGWRADIEVARDPNTRAGWFWKTMVANVLPKVLMFAALAGWFRGDDDKDTEDEGTLARMMRRISEYDLTNYTVVPLGETAQGFTAYLRLPQDDTGRIIGGLVWKALQAGFGDRDQNVTNMVRDVVDYSAGQLPSVSPVINVASSSVQFLSGRNVYDPFRGELLLTEDEMKARNPRTGLPPASVIKKFVGYEFQELGGGIVWRFVPGEARVKRETGDIRFAVDVPLLSDVAQGTFTAAEWPIVSNLIGRWLKVSNQGEKQALDKAVEPEVAGAAYARLEEKRLRNVELKALMALPKTQRTEGQYWAAARRVVEQVYTGQNMGEKAAKTALVVKKLQMGEKWGEADPIAEKVLLAGSIPEKVAVLRAAQARMSADEWRAWVTRAQNGGIVSEGVWTAFSTTRRPQEAVR